MINKIKIVIIILSLFLLTGFSAENRKTLINIKGPILSAFILSYNDFIKISNMTDEQKELNMYSIKISESNKEYIIEYIPNLLTDYEMKKRKRITIGRNIKYFIDKDKSSINKREFYK